MIGFLRSQIFNLIAATLLTLAIWMLAAERTSVTESFSGRVQVQVPVGAAVYLTKGTTKETVEVRVNGSRSAVDRARRALAAGIELDVAPTNAGDFEVDLANALQAASQPMRDLAILSVEPASMRLTVGTIVTVKAGIALPLRPEEIEGEATVEPTEASVRLPAEAAAAWPEPRKVNALLELSSFGTDQPTSVTAALRAPTELATWADHVTIVPAEATVKARLRRDRGMVVIPRVPLRINASPRAFNEYTVRLEGEPAVLQVEVSGPRAAVAALEDWSGTVYAQVDLADRQLAPGELILPISHWNLPPGLEPTRAGEDPAASVAIRLVLVPIGAAVLPATETAPARSVPTRPDE
ncbi:MAG: hypothetical protein FJ254_04945 [Phycisphaerae bacterium]|nr:hypothetical protein [Phycisphaerae bacterium]